MKEKVTISTQCEGEEENSSRRESTGLKGKKIHWSRPAVRLRVGKAIIYEP